VAFVLIDADAWNDEEVVAYFLAMGEALKSAGFAKVLRIALQDGTGAALAFKKEARCTTHR